MYKVGQKVKVSRENDNENYNLFREEILIITNCEIGGNGYDMGVYPQQLMCFKTEKGIDVPFSLYEYEIEELDLFDYPESLPENVIKIIEKYIESDNTYDTCEKLVSELETEGYTCDYYLDAIPFNLREI